MDEAPPIPYLNYNDLRQKADDFLRQYHPSYDIPVPIEEIVEFDFGIDIIPIPGLHQAFEIDGFTSSDLTSITVDEYVYLKRPNRYRFTLAHEIGHVVLHKELYSARNFNTIDGWKQFINEIPDAQHSLMEWQAYCFAGLILVPSSKLKLEVDKGIKLIPPAIDKSRKDNWDFIWVYIAEHVAKKFEVSSQVIEKRMTFDKIYDLYAPQG